MAGSLEFPGGKLHLEEERFAGLRRELIEELGVSAEEARPLIRYRHGYPDFEVDLDVWRVTHWLGEPAGLEGQELLWLEPEELMEAGLLPADFAVVRALTLPSFYAISPPEASEGDEAFLDALENTAAAARAGLILLRRPDLDSVSLLELAAGAGCRIEGTRSRLVLHGDPGRLGGAIRQPPHHLRHRLADVVAGIHVPERYLHGLTGRPVPEARVFGASCHSREALNNAVRVGADYAFLGSVRETTSHPGQPGIGWERFSEMVEGLPLPVYAIGGVGPDDLEEAWNAGAQGIAAIRSLWSGVA